ncbi:hypothetical protein DWU95_21635 [Burkholderia contaminans]|nr:hypothetical protein DWU95_21635 [Burkholderia contaminans]
MRGDTAAAAQATFEAHRAHAATERVQWQSELAADLLRLQQSLEAGMPPDAIKQRLADFTRAMLSADVPQAGRRDGASAIGE